VSRDAISMGRPVDFTGKPPFLVTTAAPQA
jgi:hypothetical protein